MIRKYLWIFPLFAFSFFSDSPWIWVRTFGSGAVPDVWHMATDADDNLYMVGQFGFEYDSLVMGNFGMKSKGGNSDMFFAKLNAAGEVLWARHIGGKRTEKGERVAVDANKNVYVLGVYDQDLKVEGKTLPATEGYDNVFVAKYNSQGSLLWAKKIGAAARANLMVNTAAMTVNAKGEIIIGSLFRDCAALGLPAYEAFSLVKLSSAGTLVWACKINEMDYNGYVSEVKTDAAGNVVVSGSYYQYNNSATGEKVECVINGFLAKVTAAGKIQWLKNVAGKDCKQALDMDVDSENNIYTAGMAVYEDNHVRAMFNKYSPQGALLWTKVLASSNGSTATRVALTTDAVYFLCRSSGDGQADGFSLKDTSGSDSPAYHQFVICKTDKQDGKILWAFADNLDVSYDFEIACTSRGEAYLSGLFGELLAKHVTSRNGRLFLVKLK